MSQNLNPGGAQPAPSPSFDQSEFERLRSENVRLAQEAQQFQSFLGQLEPYAQQIRTLQEDPSYARIFDDSVSAYKTMQARNKPQLPPEWDPEINPYLKKIDAMDERMSKFEERTTKYDRELQEQHNQRLVGEATQTAEKLCKEYPVLAEHNFRGVNIIANYAGQHNVSFDQAATDLEYMYKRTNAAVEAPSLRSGAGQLGVPSATPRPEGNMKERFIQIMKAAQ